MIYSLLTLIIATTLYSCGAPKEPTTNQSTTTSQSQITDQHNGQNSLDWAGQYIGKTQDGARVMYHIKSDNTFTKSIHHKKEDIKTIDGQIVWDKDGNHFTINGNDKSVEKFKVIENGLSLLNDKGQELNNIFKKETHQIRENYWKLTKLNGQAVKTNDNSTAEAHIILKSDNSVIGNGSCNRLNGEYTLTGMDEIRISNISNTRMSCPSLNLENDFITTLQKAHKYSINGDQLFIYNDNGQTIAEFEIVFLR